MVQLRCLNGSCKLDVILVVCFTALLCFETICFNDAELASLIRGLRINMLDMEHSGHGSSPQNPHTFGARELPMVVERK